MAGRTSKSKAQQGSSPGERASVSKAAGLAKTSAPIAVPLVDDVLVTRRMLNDVRTELIEGIDQSRLSLRTEIQGVKTDLEAQIQGLKTHLEAQIQGVKADVAALRIEVGHVKADILEIKADIAGMRADMSRMLVLMEEQNARNKVVFDALGAIIERQDRTERRLDAVEETVRALASTRQSS